MDEKFYDDILKNQENQLDEWEKLSFSTSKNAKLNIKFMLDHKTLQLDTKFFPEIKLLILNDIENLDSKTTGLLINSENYGALRLLYE